MHIQTLGDSKGFCIPVRFGFGRSELGGAGAGRPFGENLIVKILTGFQILPGTGSK